MATWVFGTSDLLGRQHQQLLDEAFGDLTQQILNGQLGLGQHAHQWQGVFRLGDKGQHVLQGWLLHQCGGKWFTAVAISRTNWAQIRRDFGEVHSLGGAQKNTELVVMAFGGG